MKHETKKLWQNSNLSRHTELALYLPYSLCSNALRIAEQILNRSIGNFYKSDGVNVIAVKTRKTKTRPISFYIHNFS